MSKVAIGFYAVCRGRETGVFTSWLVSSDVSCRVRAVIAWDMFLHHGVVRAILCLWLNGARL